MNALYECTNCYHQWSGVWLNQKAPKDCNPGFCVACWDVILSTQRMNIRAAQNEKRSLLKKKIKRRAGELGQ